VVGKKEVITLFDPLSETATAIPCSGDQQRPNQLLLCAAVLEVQSIPLREVITQFVPTAINNSSSLDQAT
jgi:hypothetical protein